MCVSHSLAGVATPLLLIVSTGMAIPVYRGIKLDTENCV